MNCSRLALLRFAGTAGFGRMLLSLSDAIKIQFASLWGWNANWGRLYSLIAGSQVAGFL